MYEKIFLSPSNQDGNRYAYGNTTEDVQCGKIAVAAETALKRCGFETKNEQYDTMQNRVAHSNTWGADMHLPIHTNACNGKVGGTRIFYGAGERAAAAMLAALRDLSPGKSDGMAREDYYEITHAKATTVYVEFEFHDVPELAKWIIEHPEEIGEGICKGVCAYFGREYIEPQTEPKEEPKQETKPENPISDSTEDIRRRLTPGESIRLKNEPLYVSSTAEARASTVTGIYYIWGNAIINGRIRITNSASRAGKSGQVTGWIAVPMRTYTVQKGDTLTKISKIYGVKISDILEANKGKYPEIKRNHIVIGWVLNIPD